MAFTKKAQNETLDDDVSRRFKFLSIDQGSGITSSISSAIEQQNDATVEISRNVQEAAEGTRGATENIAGISAANQRTGVAAGGLEQSATGLSSQSNELRQVVSRFLSDIRAA